MSKPHLYRRNGRWHVRFDPGLSLHWQTFEGACSFAKRLWRPL